MYFPFLRFSKNHASDFLVMMKFKKWCFGFFLGESVKQGTFVSASTTSGAKKYLDTIERNTLDTIERNMLDTIDKKEVRKVQGRGK